MLAARKLPSRAVVKRSLAVPSESSGYAYAHRIIYTVCCLAGCSSFVDDARDNLVNEGVHSAIEAHNTPVLFDWMVRAFSFQGIADAIAADYMDRHGALTWAAITADLGAGPACLKIPLISDEARNIGKSRLFEEELTELFHERPQAILPHGRDELIMQAALAEQRMDTSLGCAGL